MPRMIIATRENPCPTVVDVNNSGFLTVLEFLEGFQIGIRNISSLIEIFCFSLRNSKHASKTCACSFPLGHSDHCQRKLNRCM